MKKYLFIIFVLFISISAFSQVPRSRKLLGQDTAAGTGGLIYYDTLKTLVCSGCTFNSGAYSDTIVISGGGNTIYNGDGTLAANRTVSMAGRSLTFSSTGNAVELLQSGTTSTNANNQVLNSLSNGLQFIAWGSAATPSGIAAAGDGTIREAGASTNNLTIENLGSSGTIKFGINSILQATFDGTQFSNKGNILTTQTTTNATNGVTCNLNTGLAYYPAINNSTNAMYAGISGSTAATFHSVVANMAFLRGSASSAGLVIQHDGAFPIIFDVNNSEVARFSSLGTHTMTAHRFELAKGATVASATNITLGSDGNVFHISGTTTINNIIATDWQAGSTIKLIFDGSLTVKNNTSGGGGAVLLLAGGVDFSATSNDVLVLLYDGTSWFEQSRSVN